MKFGPGSPKRIPWMYNESYNPYFDYDDQYQPTDDDFSHLENHQEYISSSIPADIYEEEYGNHFY